MPPAEVALVDLDGAAEGTLELARLGHALAQAREQTVDGVAVQAGELRDLHPGQIGRDAAQEPAEFAFTDSSTDDIAVLHGKYSLSRGRGARSASHDPFKLILDRIIQLLSFSIVSRKIQLEVPSFCSSIKITSRDIRLDTGTN